jgi:AcrR family transcriptional regulator
VDGRTARWAGHREQRRREFVEAAIEVIEREGPAATVEQFTAQLGVTRQALYRQFDDRADLDRAIAERAGALLVEALLPQLDAGDDIEATVRGALAAYLDYIETHLALYRFVRAHDAEADGPASSGAVRRVKDTLAGRVAAVAGTVLGGGTTLGAAGEVLATGLVGMADAVISRWLEDPRGMSRERLVDQLATMLTGAVQAVQGAGVSPG